MDRTCLILLITLQTVLTTNAILSIPSAASPAQIKFAIENKYDDTGPGAKEPEHVYKTFKTIEDAVMNHIDDPDTKLPVSEKLRVYQNLVHARQMNLHLKPRIGLKYSLKPQLVFPQSYGNPEDNMYQYSYGVNDATTGDLKSAHETRNGELVTGYYSILHPDGIQRVVEYTADDKHGFKAVIHKF